MKISKKELEKVCKKCIANIETARKYVREDDIKYAMSKRKWFIGKKYTREEAEQRVDKDYENKPHLSYKYYSIAKRQLSNLPYVDGDIIFTEGGNISGILDISRWY